MDNNIKISLFNLELFDINNNSHNILFDELWNDDNTKKYLFDRREFINNIIMGDGTYNCIYLIKLGDEYIGFVSLYYIDNTYEICDGIINRFRNRGYSKMILTEFSKYVFDNTDINKLYCYIDKDNIASIKSALKVGFDNVDDKEYVLKK